MKNTLTILLLLPLFSFGQHNFDKFKFTGTFLTGITCKGEIILGSDSRTVVEDDKSKILAYNDRSNKIFQCKNIFFSMAGAYNFPDGNIRLVGLLKDFNTSNKQAITVNSFYNLFITYCKKRLTPLDFSILQSNAFLVVGYLGMKPYIYLYNNGIEIKHIGDNDFITNKNILNSGSQYNEIVNYLRGFTIDNAIEFTDIYIKNEIVQRNKGRVSDIGGVPCIVAISKSGSRFSNNRFIDNIYSIKEELVNMLNGNIKIKYLLRKDSIYITGGFKDYVKKH